MYLSMLIFVLILYRLNLKYVNCKLLLLIPFPLTTNWTIHYVDQDQRSSIVGTLRFSKEKYVRAVDV